MAFRLESPAFDDRKVIPREYTGEGDDKSPPLLWRDAPSGTKEFALLVEDPDAPQAEPWVHWIAYKIAPNQDRLPEGLPGGTEVGSPHLLQGQNSFRRTGYGGPMPPPKHGPHRYFFKLYALNTELPSVPGMDKRAFTKLIKDHVLAETELVGTYERH